MTKKKGGTTELDRGRKTDVVGREGEKGGRR